MNMDITWHASDYNLSLQKCYTSLYGVGFDRKYLAAVFLQSLLI